MNPGLDGGDMNDFGTISADEGLNTIRFERLLEFSPFEVWAALSEPARLAEWLAEAEVVPGPDGSISLDFGEGGRETGRITAWDPPRLLAYEWLFVGEEPSHVRWELTAVEDGRATRLTLEHTRLEPAVSSGYGAGWHAHLDQLAGHLAGSVPSWDELFAELHPRYKQLVAPTA
jgi:uncharacterized protein YndB with AHSA1/START domain